MRTATRASTDWDARWFAPAFWREIKPWLSEVEDRHRRFGPFRRLALVEATRAPDGARTLVYRAEYAELTRLVTFRIDRAGRMVDTSGKDE